MSGWFSYNAKRNGKKSYLGLDHVASDAIRITSKNKGDTTAQVAFQNQFGSCPNINLISLQKFLTP